MKNFEEMTQKKLQEMYNKMVDFEKMSNSSTQQPEPKRWRAKLVELYYHLGDDGDIILEDDIHNLADNFRYETGNYFKTEQEVEEYKKKQLLQKAYEDWCKFDCNWNDKEQVKHYVNCVFGKIYFNSTYVIKTQGAVYAKSKEIIQEFIDKIGEEDFKKYILEV